MWRSENPPAEIKAFFEADYPALGRASDVVATIKRSGLFSLADRFTLPDEAWWEDFYTPKEIRIEELRGKYEGDDEALAVLNRLAQEPAKHRKYAGHYAYEYFVARLDRKSPQGDLAH